MALAVQNMQRGIAVTNDYDTSQTGPSPLVIAAGAAVGALAIYILRTPSGQRMFNTALGLLDEFSFECARFSQSCQRAQAAAHESWQAIKGSTTNTGGARETVF